MRKIDLLRNYMQENNIDICYIASADDHISEYYNDYYKLREYISGFTGSQGTLVLTLTEALLWTDGRYFIQAAKELQNTGIKLMKSGEPGVITPLEYIKNSLSPNKTLGFDGRVTDAATGVAFDSIAQENNAKISYIHDFGSTVWPKRPSINNSPIFILEEKYTGENSLNKISRLLEKLELKDKEAYLITSLDDIAWLLNLRGNDIFANPVFYSFILITNNSINLYINNEKITTECLNYLRSIKIYIKDYEKIYNDVCSDEIENVYLDINSTNFLLYKIISTKSKSTVIDSPVSILKCKKNKVEIDNVKNTAIYDGISMFKYIAWIKENVKSGNINEYSAGQKIDSLRAENDDFIEVSFDTICAYNENAAMMHYKAEKETASKLYNKGILLTDCGGQYKSGTTDVTRTIMLGEVSRNVKEDFTSVLKGMLNLQECIFFEGTTGQTLDIVARKHLWSVLSDYKCGTGHGIGFCLNVHEGPVRLSRTGNDTVVAEGMIISNEPGIYKEGKYGIRTENMLVCIFAGENEYGRFLKFEPLTYVPIDRNLIVKEMLSKDELDSLNNYHSLVYKKLSPYLNNNDAEVLYEMTKPL